MVGAFPFTEAVATIGCGDSSSVVKDKTPQKDKTPAKDKDVK